MLRASALDISHTISHQINTKKIKKRMKEKKKKKNKRRETYGRKGNLTKMGRDFLHLSSSK